MDPNLNILAMAVRTELLHLDGVTRFSPNRRFAMVFAEGNPADTFFYIESGLVKLFERGDDTKEIIVAIASAGDIFGEQALMPNSTRQKSAEVLQEGVIHVIPRDLFLSFCDARPALWRAVAERLAQQKQQLEKKIELLSLKDVEYRILYYLRELASSIGQRVNNNEHSVPLSQGELASLIGATRETTSTTLNALARRGLIRLGRRQLVVIAPEEVRAVSASAGHSQSAHL